MEQVFGKLFKNERDAIALIVITLYIGIKTFIKNDYVYLINFDDINKTILILGGILNEMFLAFIPFGVIVLTFEGAKYKSSSTKERFQVCLLCIIAIPVFIVIYRISVWIMNYCNGDSISIIKLLPFLFSHLILGLSLVFTIFSIIMFLSLFVNNLIMFILLIVDKRLKLSNTVEITGDMETENKFINIHNYWYRFRYKISWNPYKSEREIYFIKVFIKSQKDNEILINIHREDGKLIILEQYTNINIETKLKMSELEQKINHFIEKKLINH